MEEFLTSKEVSYKGEEDTKGLKCLNKSVSAPSSCKTSPRKFVCMIRDPKMLLLIETLLLYHTD